jgi:hypothetical protein
VVLALPWLTISFLLSGWEFLQVILFSKFSVDSYIPCYECFTLAVFIYWYYFLWIRTDLPPILLWAEGDFPSSLFSSGSFFGVTGMGTERKSNQKSNVAF